MRLIFAVFFIASALSALAQGTVVFDNNLPGVVVSHVYGPDPTGIRHYGNGPTDFPPGNKDWSGQLLPFGTGWSAQLYAAPGANVPWESLLPASPVTNFKTGDEAGFVVPMIATLAGVPADSAVATLQLRVWSAQNTSWEDAQRDPQIIVARESLPFNVFNIGGSLNAPPALTGLVSFGMYSQDTLIPEPSSVSLLSLAAIALLIHRRRRKMQK